MIYNGKVVKTADFGAFVNFLGSQDGLVHISELTPGRVAKTTDVVNVGRCGEGQGHRVRRARQGQAVDAGGRSGDRRGYHRAGWCQAGSRRRAAGAEAIVRNGATGRSAASGGSGMSAPPPVTANSLRPSPTDISRWLRGPVSEVSFGRRRLRILAVIPAKAGVDRYETLAFVSGGFIGAPVRRP